MKGYAKYRKALVAAGGAGLLAALAVLDESGVMTDRPWFGAVVAALTVAGVYKVRNAPAA